MNAQIKHMQDYFESELLPRFQRLQQSEQRIVLIAAVILPLAILFFAIVMPANDRKLELQSEFQKLQMQADEAERLAKQLVVSGVSESGSGNIQGSLMTQVEQLTREHALRKYMTRIRPEPSLQGGSQRLMMQMKDAPYSECLKLLDVMARKGLQVINIKFQAVQSPGLVNLQMVIEKL